MTDEHAGVIYKVYGYDNNAYWRAMVNAGRATLGTRGTDERGAYVLVTLVPLATFAGGRR